MDALSLKRQSPDEDEPSHDGHFKRQRTATLEPEPAPIESALVHTTDPSFEVVNNPAAEDLGRDGLRRSIALALQHVGFDSARNDALESFTEAVDTYITGFVNDLKRTANAARRVDPTPTDFEATLGRHNIPLSSLKPHLKTPIPKEQLTPTFYNPIKEDLDYLQNSPPALGDELDGKYEKEEKSWIPKSFPAFPSKHSYKWTPLKEKPRDPQKKRAVASADARNGEKALRRIDRAAKISRQKELKEMANRNPLSRQRHEAWETLMKDLLPASGAMEIADHSTIVNASAKYSRKELPRASRRAPVEPN
ncbi:Bromodomain associated-domain-containing protein [Biscogniauxia marginata]|nr:Bromodomain associated-domain-containing protein [Biscogniauxia marginata]